MIPGALLRICNAVFVASPSDSLWAVAIIWLVRVATLLIILRNYIAPYVLERIAGGIRSVRVRSISLRSIRGIYVRRGIQTWRVDRIGISYRSASGEGSSRFTVKIEGLKLEIGKTGRVSSKPASSRNGKKRLTLADLSPSPLAIYLWSIVARIYAFVEPYLRPVIRYLTVACIRVFIQCLPALTQALHFDLDGAEVTFLASPQSCLRVKEATLHTQLHFTQLEGVILPAGNDSGAALSRGARSMTMVALRMRLMKSFERTWEKAWGKTQGTASIAMTVNDVSGLTPFVSQVGESVVETFLSLPGPVDFHSSLRFSPSRGIVDPHSLKADLNVDSVQISIDALHSLLSLFKDGHPFEPTSPWDAPPSAALSSTTPMSPFIQVLRSATSTRLLMPKLKEARPSSWLSMLMMVNVKLSSLKLTTRSKRGETYETVVREIAFNSGLSSPDQSSLHQQFLGRNLLVDNGIDVEVYAVDLSADSIYLDRAETEGHGRLRVVSVAHLRCDMLVSQWPWPRLSPSPFLSGDPNTPLLAVRIGLGTIEAAERLDVLQRIITDTTPVQHSNASPLLPSILSPVPRVALSIDVGSCSGRLICVDPSRTEPFAMEVRTDGFTLSIYSHFVLTTLRRNNTNREFSDCLPLQMKFDISLVSKPTFLRVRSDHLCGAHRFSKLDTTESDCLGDPVFSLETVEINGQGTAVGDIKDDAESIVSIDSSSIFLDLHCSTDALSVEFWHPSVIAATTAVLSVTAKSSSEIVPTAIPSRLHDRLPTGLSCTLSLTRFVFFATGPDLNPDEDMDVTRGIAFRTGLSMHYCAVHPGHTQGFPSLPARSQSRQKLYLPEERIMEAVAAAKSSMVTQQTHAFVRVALWNTALRSAAATQYVADDPFIAERDDPALKPREFVQIPGCRADINVIGKRGRAVAHSGQDSCQLILHIPYACGTFQLVHVYSLLLAVQTVKSMMKYQTRVRRPPIQEAPGTIAFHLKATVKTLQVFWNLSTQRFATRIDSMNAHYSLNEQVGMGLNSLLLWVPVPPRLSRWDESMEEKWEELGRLQKWCISLPPSSGDGKIVLVEGDAARLRIPSGFVLAHLILDISVTVKCLRHLTHMIAAGSYSDMRSPMAEAAKKIPNLIVRIGCLFIEAADDPLETKLGVIWRAGSGACRQRLDREEAFKAKVAAILAAETHSSLPSARESDSDFQFSAAHTVSVEDAHVRLSMVHAVDWALRLQEAKNKCSRQERELNQRLLGQSVMKGAIDIPNLVAVTAIEDVPPLFRAVFHGLHLKTSPPSFSGDALPDFLYEHGKGIPRDTQFSLLLPMHLKFSLNSLRVCLRDYPIPLVDIPEHAKKDTSVWEFDTDLVVAEEMGTPQSVDWIKCRVVGVQSDIHGAKPMWINVPKTIMPVKSYANPTIRVATHHVTSFAWGVSYGAATQDLTRVLDTLSTSPRDSSPHLGFWDKIRLIFHWKIKVSFAKEVRLHMKGTRDPYNVMHTGAGFAFCWQGHPTLMIGYENPDQEVIQMISESMLIVIPNLTHVDGQTALNAGVSQGLNSSSTRQRDFQKICAKFSSGVRFGVGFVPERSCVTCSACVGSAFERRCRFFNFRPHFDVKLALKEHNPMANNTEDSYNGFRSDFIHLSVSLTSSLRPPKLGQRPSPSSLHLSPKSFAHFWSWWALFEGVMSLPIRQGTYYPTRTISPKFGRHLATLKYRISVDQLFISHAYIDDSRESWVDGVTSFIGAKAMIDKFRADMHQRDQESIIPGRVPDAIKVVRHKPFYAAEVVLNGLDLRAMMAVFADPMKQSVDVTSSGLGSNYRTRKDLPTTDTSSSWFDLDDFVETDWLPSSTPTVHLLPAVACSRLTYFKRNSTLSESPIITSKFGDEDSHLCLLGKENSVAEVQIGLASERIVELGLELEYRRRHHVGASGVGHAQDDDKALEKKISLLETYVAHLREAEMKSNARAGNEQTYYMPSDTVSADEWSEFDNVYQVHCPKIFLNNAIRDILIQYYHCSRSWRGLEYHMATRAVKFIRDQAEATVATILHRADDKPKGHASSAQAAAHALRKILTGERGPNTATHVSDGHMPQASDAMDPLNGWSDGVSLRKSHFCLLLKPQIVLRSETNADSVCVLAAVQAKLQSFAIMDTSNVEDPISGKIMSRSYTSLNGLQTFSPANSENYGNGCVPLEVLIDYRCESFDFDRLVPQTDATFHYDKFNRLRLRNNVTSVTRTAPHESLLAHNSHLSNETDLIQIHVPRFTVTASDLHFQDISNIITELILFSDVAHKKHMERLETLVFAYDFTDLSSAANVVADLQSRLRIAAETRREAEIRFQTTGYEGSAEILKLKAHIFLLAEELNLLFDAIKLAQDRTEDETDQKSALLLRASASEISWRMLDERRDLLAKLVMQHIDYSWLSRQDSSTVNNLAIGDLQAFDGSPHAVWPEIISKYREPANHPLCKRELFILADWTVLAPVGGITIYESFELSLHPMRLQVDAKVGSRIMEYVWPARRHRNLAVEDRASAEGSVQVTGDKTSVLRSPSRKSLDSSRALEKQRTSFESSALAPPPLRRLGASRSFTDLRDNSTTSDFTSTPRSPISYKGRTVDAVRLMSNFPDPPDNLVKRRNEPDKQAQRRKVGDAAEMKTRSSQKTFILVKISSLHLLLSIVKEESFDLRDARIRTRDLEYRNQTWSFEELVDQFIPADMTWRGWVKMAFHQPLVPVLPVARELFSKTKWIASKGAAHMEAPTFPKMLGTKEADKSSDSIASQNIHPNRRWRKKSAPGGETPPSEPFIANAGNLSDDSHDSLSKPRSRMFNILHQKSSSHSRTHTKMSSEGSSDSLPSRHRSNTIRVTPPNKSQN